MYYREMSLNLTKLIRKSIWWICLWLKWVQSSIHMFWLFQLLLHLFIQRATYLNIHIHLSSHPSIHPPIICFGIFMQRTRIFFSNLFLFDLGSAINSKVASRPDDEYFVWISFLNAFFPECFCLNFLIANYLNSLFVLF